jgi:hypothetical protein
MIRVDKDGTKVRYTKEFSCISSDKPNLPKKSTGYSEKIPTSSTMYVIDTGEVLMYTEDLDDWFPV